MLLDNNYEKQVFIDDTNYEISGVMEMALEDYAELEAAYGDLRVAQCVDEFALYKQNGEIVDEAAASSFLQKVKDFFKSVWDHIKKFWAKIVDKFRQWFANSEKYYAANKAKILAGAPKVTGFKGYKYGDIQEITKVVEASAKRAKILIGTGDSHSIKTYAAGGGAIQSATPASVKAGRDIADTAKGAQKAVKKVAANKGALDKLRTDISGKPDAEGFKYNLIKRYRGENKVELTSKDINLGDLAIASNINKSIAICAKNSDDLMASIINQVDSLAKSGEAKNQEVSNKVAFLKEVSNIFRTAMSVCASLMSASLNQTKAFAIAAVRAAGGGNAKSDDQQQQAASESAYMDYFSENGIAPIGEEQQQEEDNGIYVDEEGYLVNAYGQYVDEEGNLIEG